jgi:hypothetical protein
VIDWGCIARILVFIFSLRNHGENAVVVPEERIHVRIMKCSRFNNSFRAYGHETFNDPNSVGSELQQIREKRPCFHHFFRAERAESNVSPACFDVCRIKRMRGQVTPSIQEPTKSTHRSCFNFMFFKLSDANVCPVECDLAYDI